MNVLIYFQTQTQVESFQELVRRLQVEAGEMVFYTTHPSQSTSLDFKNLSSYAQPWGPNLQMQIEVAYYFGDVHMSMFAHVQLRAIRDDFYYQPCYPFDQLYHPNPHEFKVLSSLHLNEDNGWSRDGFFQAKGMTINLPVVLWLPSPDMNTSSIPGIWDRILDLSSSYNVVFLATGGLDSFFTDKYLKLSQAHPNLFYAESEVAEWMKSSDILLSDLNSYLLNYCQLDKPIILFDNPHLLDLLNSQRDLPWFYQRDFAPRIHRPRDLKSVISSQLEDPNMYSNARQAIAHQVSLHSMNLDHFLQQHQSWKLERPKSVKWLLRNPMTMGEIQPLLNDSRVSEIFLIEPKFTPTMHPKLRQINQLELPQIQTELLADEIIIYQYASGILKGDWSSVVEEFSLLGYHVMSPLTVGDSRLARLQSHIKSEYYQLGAQVNIEDLVHFLKLSQKGESYSIPELDVPLLILQAQHLGQVMQSINSQGLHSPYLSMGLSKELLFIPQG